MSQKNVLLRGAFILTVAGIIGRIVGFFYRIFLSRIIGAEGMGLYQLVFPLYALAASLTVSGIQTCISRFVSAKAAFGDKRGAVRIFYTGMLLSLCLSLAVSAALLCFHDALALSFVREPRCSQLLRLLAYAIPFTSVHACIDGYYYGMKRTSIPAVGQIMEHAIRLAVLFLLYFIWTERNIPITPAIAVYGIIIEEFAAALFSVTAITLHFSNQPPMPPALHRTRYYLNELLTLSTPLTLNRVLVSLLQSLESMLIPLQLQLAGMNASDALSIYGILTGMAMPLILFPNAVTSSVSTMLLPVISEAQAKQDRPAILRAVRKTCFYCLLLGIAFWLAFLLLGSFLGNFLFQSRLAGSFIAALSWLCPMLYLNPALFAILNGLGLTKKTFLHNMTGILIRLLFILFAVPVFGILGYFWGMVTAQFILTLSSALTLKKQISSSHSG